MELNAAIDHIKRSSVSPDKWEADDFIADNCPPEAGEMEAAFAAILNEVAYGTLAMDYKYAIARLIAERDSARAEIAAMEAAMSQPEYEAAQAGTFAQGIEAAVEAVYQRWGDNDAPPLRDYIRALSPTPQADPVREAAQWHKTTDGLPKKPGKRNYEQIECLIMLPTGEMEISMWNCEHEVWDDADGDDYRHDPCKPTHWLALGPIRALAQKGE